MSDDDLSVMESDLLALMQNLPKSLLNVANAKGTRKIEAEAKRKSEENLCSVCYERNINCTYDVQLRVCVCSNVLLSSDLAVVICCVKHAHPRSSFARLVARRSFSAPQFGLEIFNRRDKLLLPMFSCS